MAYRKCPANGCRVEQEILTMRSLMRAPACSLLRQAIATPIRLDVRHRCCSLRFRDRGLQTLPASLSYDSTPRQPLQPDPELSRFHFHPLALRPLPQTRPNSQYRAQYQSPPHALPKRSAPSLDVENGGANALLASGVKTYVSFG